MTIEEMKKRKIELGLTGTMIAEASGVPLGTIQKIFSGATKVPRKSTIDALTKVLEIRPERTSYYAEHADLYGRHGNAAYMKVQAGAVKEPVGNYSAVPKHGTYTIADYDGLPQDQRMELIDGELYDMGAPSGLHQKLLGLLFLMFDECIEEHGSNCEVFFAPCDVRLDRDDYTVVQPDLMVICGDYKGNFTRYEGPPELVLEVLSDSTRTKDLFLKLFKYQNAGVREYWIVDPKYQTVTVHFFDTDNYEPMKYDFHSEVPVNISGGMCRIDFSRILGRMQRYFQ